MKTLTCTDVSGMDCPFVAEAETAEEAKTMLMEHGASEHADAMAAMSDEEKAEMMQKADDLLAAQE